MNQLQDQHVLILGLGASGLAMARWCARCGANVSVADTREAPPQLATLQADLPQAKFVGGAFTASLVEGTDVRAVFASPGLAPSSTAAVLDVATAQGLWTGGELDLFSQALADLKSSIGYAPKVLAVTGTNGKTTVTALTGQLVERAGRTVVVAGNIGPTLLGTLSEALDAQAASNAARAAEEAANPVVEEAATQAVVQDAAPVVVEDAQADDAQADDDAIVDDKDAEEDDEATVELTVEPAPQSNPADYDAMPQVWVVELSSFQLHGVRGFEPTAATILNVTQDHLDWHGDMASYTADKGRVFGSRGAMVLNREDAAVMAFMPQPVKTPRGEKPQPPRTVITFGTDMPQRPGDFGIESPNGMTWLVRALEADETRRRRKDEAEELHIQRLMPADALRIRGRHNAANALAALALATSAGCALGPMLYGLREYRGEPHRVELVGLLNGVEYFDDSKGTNVGATVAALQGLGADRHVVVILGGEGKGQDFTPLAAPVQRYARSVVLIGRDAPLIRSALEGTGISMEDASSMQEAVALATQRSHSGDAVLMSPACASFDMFDNYSHRGQVFRESVQALADEAGIALEVAS